MLWSQPTCCWLSLMSSSPFLILPVEQNLFRMYNGFIHTPMCMNVVCIGIFLFLDCGIFMGLCWTKILIYSILYTRWILRFSHCKYRCPIDSLSRPFFVLVCCVHSKIILNDNEPCRDEINILSQQYFKWKMSSLSTWEDNC